jgi:hypothetical protein
MLEQVLLYGVLVKASDGAQPAGDGGPSPTAGFQVTGKALDVRPPCLEQAQAALLAPVRVLAQVQSVGLAGQAGVTSQEPSQRQLLAVRECRLGDGDRGGRGRSGGGHRAPPGSG